MEHLARSRARRRLPSEDRPQRVFQCAHAVGPMRSEENDAARVQQVRRTGSRPEGAMHRAVDIVDSNGKFEAVMASEPAGVPQFVLSQARLP